MLETYIFDILKKEEFQHFLTVVRDTHQKFIQSQEVEIMDKFESLKEQCIMMGRAYNHFIFKISDWVLEKINYQSLRNEELVKKTVGIFLKEVEEKALKLYEEEMSFFFLYRDKTKSFMKS